MKEYREHVLSTTFSALRTDQIRTSGQALGNMLGMPNHVHVENAMLVKAVHDRPRGNSNCRDKQFRSRVDDDGNQFIQFPYERGISLLSKFRQVWLPFV